MIKMTNAYMIFNDKVQFVIKNTTFRYLLNFAYFWAAFTIVLGNAS